MDNPFKASSRSHRIFEVVANADRALSPEEIAGAVGERNPMVVHSVLKNLRARGCSVYRYRDPNGAGPTASVYSLHPVEGLAELAAPVRERGRRRSAGPPQPIHTGVRQPLVGSVCM